jgi:hypothetical protein
MHTSQYSKPPDGGCAQREQEDHSDQPVQWCAFAPALEHSHDSSHEKQDGYACQHFKPHGVPLLTSLPL